VRILVFTDHFYPEPSAPAAHIFERSRLWAAAGHQVTVVASAPNFPEGVLQEGYRNAWRSEETLDGVRVVRVKTFVHRNEGVILRSLDYLSYLPSALLQSFREPRPDVVFASTPHLFVPCAALAHGALRGVPVVTEVRDLWPDSLLGTTSSRRGVMFGLLRVLERTIYRFSTRLVALTPGIRDSIVHRGTPAEKVAVVLNGANLELFKPRPAADGVLSAFGLRERFVVGYVGTVGLAHDLASAVRAFALLQDTPATLFIVGVGAAKSGLQKLVAEEGIHNVVFAPRQKKEDVPAFWSVCRVGLVHLRNIPVFATAVPSKIFESMAMGLPVLYAGPDSYGAEIVRERGAGVCVPSGQPEVLAQAVESLMADPARLRTMAVASLASAPSFTRQAQAAGTLRALEKAIADLSGT
jgi:glycosyltransferase involved in cell wall biosynthesis